MKKYHEIILECMNELTRNSIVNTDDVESELKKLIDNQILGRCKDCKNLYTWGVSPVHECSILGGCEESMEVELDFYCAYFEKALDKVL